ncbi:MAG: hypothetical protein ACJAT2_000239 [Bacteriovoracaceae bacterium]|jgi:hypothetical protein
MEYLKTKDISKYSDQFQDQEFCHLVLDDFLEIETANKIKEDIGNLDKDTLRIYKHFNAKVRSSIGRKGLSKSILMLIDHLQSDIFLNELRLLTGIPDLVPDLNLAQGGALSYQDGHFVNLHTDNQTHPFDLGLKTSLSLLIYLNPEWKDEYKGFLEIRNKENTQSIAKIKPSHNRLVIMEANKDSIHGLPDIISCPEDIQRKAIVLWYYRPVKKPSFHPTTYYSKKTDKLTKKIFVFTGNLSLKVYYLLRRFFGDWDPFITRIMGLFGK